jgi:hypothetical protein
VQPIRYTLRVPLLADGRRSNKGIMIFKKTSLYGILLVPIILIVIHISVGFYYPTFREVNRYLHGLEKDYNWALEHGPDMEVGGYIDISSSDHIIYFFGGSESFYAFRTPHYMIFATVRHTNGRVREMSFTGPSAGEAMLTIKDDLDTKFSKVKYTVTNEP